MVKKAFHMTPITIQPLSESYYEWASEKLTQEWASERVVSRGVLYYPLRYPGFVAVIDNQPQGLLIHHINGDQCEVLVINSVLEGMGIGSALIEQARQTAIAQGCARLWLITTNDNIHAIRWYQRRGFTIAAIHVNALENSRKLKPEIPLYGNDGIPLRDEIEFEMWLNTE